MSVLKAPTECLIVPANLRESQLWTAKTIMLKLSNWPKIGTCKFFGNPPMPLALCKGSQFGAVLLAFVQSAVVAHVTFCLVCLLFPRLGRNSTKNFMFLGVLLFTVADILFRFEKRALWKMRVSIFFSFIFFSHTFLTLRNVQFLGFSFFFKVFYGALTALLFVSYFSTSREVTCLTDTYVAPDGLVYYLSNAITASFANMHIISVLSLVTGLASILFLSVLRRIALTLLYPFYEIKLQACCPLTDTLVILFLMNLSTLLYFISSRVIETLIVYNISFIRLEIDPSVVKDLNSARLYIHQIMLRYHADESFLLKKHILLLKGIQQSVELECININGILKRIREARASVDRSIFVTIPQVSNKSAKRVYSYRILHVILAKIKYYFHMSFLEKLYDESRHNLERIYCFMHELTVRENHRTLLDAFTTRADEINKDMALRQAEWPLQPIEMNS